MGSCVGSLRLLGRRALARGIPMLWGTTCPAFARWMTRSCAARRRASAPSPGSPGGITAPKPPKNGTYEFPHMLAQAFLTPLLFRGTRFLHI